ncbi:MAG: glycerol-3-phosphate acyltransferase [Candidatus Dormibacteria bacterium]
MPASFRRVLFSAAGGYLLGAIPTGVIVGRLAAGIDVRQYGSRVSGATNVLRSAGPGAAAATFFGDTAKGYVAARFGSRLQGDWGAVAASTGAAVGHSWPAFAGFQGGRSVLSCWGSLLALDAPSAVAAAAGGGLTVASTRYVSLGALTGVTVAAVGAALRARDRSPRGAVFASFALGFLVLRHRDNLERLRRGEEHRLGERVEASASNGATF